MQAQRCVHCAAHQASSTNPGPSRSTHQWCRTHRQTDLHSGPGKPSANRHSQSSLHRRHSSNSAALPSTMQSASLTVCQHCCKAQGSELLPQLSAALPLRLHPAEESAPLLLPCGPRLLHFPCGARAIAACWCTVAVAAAAVGHWQRGRIRGGAPQRPLAAKERRAERRRCSWRAGMEAQAAALPHRGGRDDY